MNARRPGGPSREKGVPRPERRSEVRRDLRFMDPEAPDRLVLGG